MAHARKIEIHDRGQGQRPTGVPAEVISGVPLPPPVVSDAKPVSVETEPNPPPQVPAALKK